MSRGRTRFSQQQVAELWQRWHAGQTFAAISQALSASSGGVSRVLTAAGGIRPAVPTRSARTLSRAERHVIERGRAAGLSMRALARSLARAPSTISREILRNGARTTRHRGYRAATADARAWRAAEDGGRFAEFEVLEGQRVVARGHITRAGQGREP